MTEHAYERTPLTLATDAAHAVRLPPRMMRGRLTGSRFDTNKTFIRPGRRPAPGPGPASSHSSSRPSRPPT
jgi:hypothetical protein